jgi:predicted protein tyrosine phosphatase
MPEFTVCGKNEVSRVVKRFEATHVLSLLDPYTSIWKPEVPPQNWLIQFFEDEEDLGGFRPPTMEHAERILEWGRNLPTDARVVVHCHAGVSRSTATGLALWLQANGTEHLQGAREWLKSVRPVTCPNMLLARMFDELLSLKGEFATMCDEIGNEGLITKFGKF